MSQTLPVGGFEWKKNTSKFNEKLIKDYNEDIDIEYILELDVECPKSLYNLHNDLPFLPEKTEIKKFYKLACNLHNYYVAHIRTLKQASDHGLIFKKCIG